MKAVDEHSFGAINASRCNWSISAKCCWTLCVCRVVLLVTPAAAGNLSTADTGCMWRSIFPVDIWAHPDHSFSVSDRSQSLLKGFFFNLRRPKTSSKRPLLDLAAGHPWGCGLQLSKGTEVPLPCWLRGARVLSLPPHRQGICSRHAQHFWFFLGWGKFYLKVPQYLPFPMFQEFFPASLWNGFSASILRTHFRNSRVVKSMLKH